MGMASIRQTRSGKWELCVRHKLLRRRVYFTCDSEQEAHQRGLEYERILAVGVVPPDLVVQPTRRLLLVQIIRNWIATGQAAQSDAAVLEVVNADVVGLGLEDITYEWAEGWVRRLKLERNLAPSTIRKRVQALARVIDWFQRGSPGVMIGNPLKLLPRGYSSYTQAEAREAENRGLKHKRDEVRDRRLHAGEEDKIRAVMGPSMLVLFQIILYTGARLREAYTLRWENIDLKNKVLRVQTTKQRHGRVVFRDIPIQKPLFEVLSGLKKEGELVLPFWDGRPESLTATTNRLSQRFKAAFKAAGCVGLTEHDLRHEATCRWLELKDSKGVWLFRREELNRIMGWGENSAMALRYASFRAGGLAARLWAEGSGSPSPAD